MKSTRHASIIVGAILLGAALALPAGASSAPATAAAAHAAATAAAASAVASGGHHHGHRHGGFVGFGFRFPYFSYSYGPYGYHGYGRYPYRYGYPGYGYHPRYRHYAEGERLGGLDLNVRPKKAEVYVDGKYVGVAGQYDGWPTYLWLEPGAHKIAFFHEGYATVERDLEIQSDLVADLHVRMDAGTAVSPEVAAPPSDEPVLRPGNATGSPGRLRVSVTPDDAVIYLDGHFFGIASELSQVRAGLSVEAGEHTVEVVRPGYRTITRTIDVDAGEQVDLDLALDRR